MREFLLVSSPKAMVRKEIFKYFFFLFDVLSYCIICGLD